MKYWAENNRKVIQQQNKDSKFHFQPVLWFVLLIYYLCHEPIYQVWLNDLRSLFIKITVLFSDIIYIFWSRGFLVIPFRWLSNMCIYYHIHNSVLSPIGSNQTWWNVFVASPLSTQHEALRRKSKDWLARNQDNVSEWGNMSICRLLLLSKSLNKMMSTFQLE